MVRRICLLAVGLLMFAVSPMVVMAADACTPWAAKLASLQGSVEVKSSGSQVWETGVLDATYCAGDTIRVGANSRAAVILPNETLLRLDQNTVITLVAVEAEAESLLELLSGIVNFISRVPRSLKINTPYVNASIEGTEFVLAVKEKQADITVFEGTVLAQNPQGELRLASGESATAVDGQAPSKVIVVRPRDAVQWALYYPPLLDIREGKASLIGSALTSATERFNAGDVAGALSSLDTVPRGLHDVNFYTYRAAVRLYVGRVDDAHDDLKRALNLDPAKGTAIALQSVISVTQNDKDQALQLAQQAAELSPEAAAPQIALSYAHQARFDLDAALASTQRAVELEADNALAWARLAELRLSIGELDAALAAAETAVAHNPNLSRGQSILGYAYLTQIKLENAGASFDKAVQLDSASPLSRLGLGLSKVRKGELETGRQDIEIAASLDPSNALIRSYLGKAYYEERRDDLAGDQYAMAKELDPKDPTPYYYDAIRKQVHNRPVEALKNIEKSIELNDNRAVFRSKFQLDADEAARSANQARIYQDLGFEQLALEEGAKSVNTDPTNHSAHRFLSDSYASRRRHEIARVSELLQSQLLQPININPVQPQLGEANLFVLEGAGPADTSFNEFTPLFTRNQVALHVAAVAGSNDTLGDEVTVSGIADRLSFSLGQYHFETDGFRENNDVEHDIYNAFVQFPLSPATSIQAEVRHRETESGDLQMRFDPDNFLPNRRLDINRDTVRLGFHHKPSAQNDIIGSLIYRDLDETLTDKTVPAGSPFITEISIEEDGKGYSGELQYLHRTDWLNWVIGAGHFEDNFTATLVRSTFLVLDPSSPPIPLGPTIPTIEHPDPQHSNAYLYSNIRLKPNLTLTAGLSYDSYEDSDSDEDRLNPKLGLLWETPQGTTLRAAWFKTLKRPFAANQTIEPTQVAGFNQFFDDFEGTRTTRYGAALEQRITQTLFAGVEATWRELELDRESSNDKQDEQLHRAYLSWAPNKKLSVNAEYVYEDFDNNSILTSVPTDLTTHRVPLGVNFYWPNGLIAQLRANYVDQEVKESGISEDDQFWVTDASIAYRLPKRRGVLRLTARNLFDKQFNYHDVNFNTGAPLIPLFQPERQLFAHITLAF